VNPAVPVARNCRQNAVGILHHHHCLVLEGGFDKEGRFILVPLSGLEQMTEVFRRRLIWLLVEKKLLAEDFAQNLLSARLLSCENIRV